jgi:hypothetical protein
MLYPKTFDDKEVITAYLDAYNTGKDTGEQIIYTDLAATISGLTGSIMDGITIVLIAFASISLVVSLIMISIITYTSVLERTREIGILRALVHGRKTSPAYSMPKPAYWGYSPECWHRYRVAAYLPHKRHSL